VADNRGYCPGCIDTYRWVIYSTALEYLWNGIIKVAMYAWDNMIYFIIGIAAVCAIVYIVKLNKKKALGK
jgi:hypothetical protein